MTLRYLLRRILLAIPTTFLLLVVSFLLVHLVPVADPVARDEANQGTSASFQRVSEQLFREHFGLDLPVFVNLRWNVTAEDLLPILETSGSSDAAAAAAARREIVETGRFGVGPLLAIARDSFHDDSMRNRACELAIEAGKEVVRSRDSAAERARKRAANEQLEQPLGPRTVNGIGRIRTADDRERFLAAFDALPGTVRERFATRVSEIAIATLCETRFANYLGNLLALDFGSAISDRQPIAPELWRRLKRSFALGSGYVVLSLTVSIPLGILLAALRRSRAQRVLTLGFSLLYCAPTFFVALLLQRVFALGEPFSWLPIGGSRTFEISETGSALEQTIDLLRHLVLPVIVLSLPTIAILVRYLQGALEEAMQSDYVRTARAKGFSERRAMLTHALRNALLPLATVIGYFVPALVSGAAVIEFIFDYPGIGEYFVNAVVGSDFNVVLAVTLVSALATQLGFLLSDVLLALCDPRIDLERGGAA